MLEWGRRGLFATVRQRLTAAVAAFAAALWMWWLPTSAAAVPPYEYKIFQCNNASKYGCQTFFVNYFNNIFGQYFEAVQARACTARADDADDWRLDYLYVVFNDTNGPTTFSRGPTAFQTSHWCDEGNPPGSINYVAGSSDDWIYQRAHGVWKIQTFTRGLALGDQTCTNWLARYNTLGNYSQGNANSVTDSRVYAICTPE